MKPRDLWVDFNDVDDDSRVCTLLRYATLGVSVVIGQRIVVGDDEGNRCEAQVTGLHDGMVELVVDGNTFTRPDAAEHPSLIRT